MSRRGRRGGRQSGDGARGAGSGGGNAGGAGANQGQQGPSVPPPRITNVSRSYFYPGSDIPMGYRGQGGYYISGQTGLTFFTDKQRQDYEFEMRQFDRRMRLQNEAAANARKAYLELAGSLAVVREGLFTLGKVLSPLITETRAFRDAQRELAESSRFSGISVRDLTAIQKQAMESLRLNAKTAAEVVTVLSQLSAQAGRAGDTMKNVSGLFDLATSRGLTLKEAIQGMRQALSGSLEGTPLADKLFMKDLRAVLNDYAQAIGKRNLFDLTQAEKATAVMKEFERQTGLAAGAYERFLDTSSGKQAIFEERMEAFLATVGKRIDMSFTGAQVAISALIDSFLSLDKATHGLSSAFAASLASMMTVRIALLGFVGTANAAVHSLKSLNVELKSLGVAAGFVSRNLGLLSLAIGLATSAFSLLAMESADYKETTEQMIKPIDEQIAALKRSEASLRMEAEALELNTSAIRKNLAERERLKKNELGASKEVRANVEDMKTLVGMGLTSPHQIDMLINALKETLPERGFSSVASWFQKTFMGRTDLESSELQRRLFLGMLLRGIGEASEQDQEIGENFRRSTSLFSGEASSFFSRRNAPTINKALLERAAIISRDDADWESSLTDATSIFFSNLLRRSRSEDPAVRDKALKQMRLVLEASFSGEAYERYQRESSQHLEGLRQELEKANRELLDFGSPPDSLKSSPPSKPAAPSGSFPLGAAFRYEETGGLKQVALEVLQQHYAGGGDKKWKSSSKQSLKNRIRVIDADTYEVRIGEETYRLRLLGVDAFETAPTGDSEADKRKAARALEQLRMIKTSPSDGQGVDFRDVAERIFNLDAAALRKRLKLKEGATFEEALLQASMSDEAGLSFVYALGESQKRLVSELMNKAVSVDFFGVNDFYGRSLGSVTMQSSDGEALALAGYLLREGLILPMRSSRLPPEKFSQLPKEEQQAWAVVQKIEENLMSFIQKRRAGRRSGGVGRIDKTFSAANFEEEMARIDAQLERFERDNYPQLLSTIARDLNYELGLEKSFRQRAESARKTLEAKRLEAEKAAAEYRLKKTSQSKREMEAARLAFEETERNYRAFEAKASESRAFVREMTDLKVSESIQGLRSQSTDVREAARIGVRSLFGEATSMESRRLARLSANEINAMRSFMATREGAGIPLSAYMAAEDLVRNRSLAERAELYRQAFASGDIMGSGGERTALALGFFGRLAQASRQGLAMGTRGIFDAAFGSKELDSAARQELRALEYARKRQELLEAEFETERERRLRLQVLEEERMAYLESQTDSFGTRLKEVFSATADFAGEVFKQALAEALAARVGSKAVEGLFGLALGLIPGGGAIKEFLGLSSGGYVPSGSVRVVGENPDGSWNSTTELVATGSMARVFGNQQSKRIAQALSETSVGVMERRETFGIGLRQISLLERLVDETRKSMILTREGGEALARRGWEETRYKERFGISFSG